MRKAAGIHSITIRAETYELIRTLADAERRTIMAVVAEAVRQYAEREATSGKA